MKKNIKLEELDIENLDAFNNFEYSSKYFRACVGRNGLLIDKDMTLYYGYAETVEMLFKSIEKLELAIDGIIYPFMFCCRHAIELILKQSIHKLILINSIKNQTSLEEIQTTYKKDMEQHALRKLTEDLINLSTIDERLKNKFEGELKNIHKLLSELYEDEKSDKYRYAYGKDNQLNLDGKYLLAADIVYYKFIKISHLLENFFYLCDHLLEEYKIGTFNKKLSRYEIKEISEILPLKKLWTDSSFLDTKNNIRKKYNLTSNDFSKAVNIIKGHREFCVNIGEEIPFGSFEKDTLRKTAKLIKLSEEYNSLVPKEITLFNPAQEKEYEKESLKIIKTIPFEDLILLLTFINIANDQYYSEELDTLYNNNLQNINRNDEYLLSKCFYCKYKELMNGFAKCGQTTYIKQLTSYYQNI